MGMPSLGLGVRKYPKEYLDTYGIGGTSLDSGKPKLIPEMPAPEESLPAPMPMRESGVGSEDLNATAALTRPEQTEQDYSYGLEAPQAPKQKWWQTLLDYAIPTVIGASEGHGVIPSLGYAHLLRESNKGDQLAAAQKGYGEERKFRQKEREIDSLTAKNQRDYDLKEQMNKELMSIRKSNLGLQERKVGAIEQNVGIKKAQAKDKIQEAVDAADNLNRHLDLIYNTTQKIPAGRIAGNVAILKSKVKSDPDMAAYKASVGSTLSNLARALGEKGVLTDQDILRIQDTIESPSQSREEQKAVYEQMKHDIQTKINQWKKRQEAIAGDETDSSLQEFGNISDAEIDAELAARGL